MIRISKNAERPQTLDKGYNTEEVCEQLLIDQHDKCYLCERYVPTDYQVEHLKSKANNPELVQVWGNLFVACSYCNNKKSNKFDDILEPAAFDIEVIIKHSNDFSNQKALFTSEDTSTGVVSTIRLLNLLFNGKLPFRNHREQRFYDEFIRKLNIFSFAVNEYIAGEQDEYRTVIEEQLDIHSEYLGFKYMIIHSNKLLEQDFGHMTIWNKKGE